MPKVDQIFHSSFDSLVENIFQKPTAPRTESTDVSMSSLGDYIEIYKEKKSIENQKNQLVNLITIKTESIKQLKDEVSRLKRTEKELIEEKNQATLRLKASDRVLANMSHEIRTPMNGVIGMADILRETRLTETQQRYLNVIEKSSKSILSIINDILNHKKGEAGKLELESTEFKLEEIIQDVEDLFSPKISEKKLSLHRSIDPEIPRAVFGDPGKLRQILINLVNNAIKFTDQGTVELNVERLSTVNDLITLRFKVIDSGIGIDVEQQKKLFQPYTQANASISGKYGGTGLGLSISRKLAELMDGEIGMESEPGTGSTFWFTVKVSRGKPVAHRSKHQKKDTPSRREQERKIRRSQTRLLVVEDDPINQQVSKHLLSKSGYPVEIAGSGEEALHLLSEKEIDLVLMDIEMPVMNGFKTTNAIRDRTRETINPAIPIVAMTAHATTGYREKCLSANMNEYISKPIDILKLDAIVDQLLTHDSSQQTITELSRSNALDEPIINTRKLNQLREDVEEMFPVIVDKFLGTLPEKLNQLELAVNEANYTRIKDSAHRLRGSCASLYAEKMAGLCQELERLNPTYSQRSITTLLSSLRIEARNVEELLRTTV